MAIDRTPIKNESLVRTATRWIENTFLAVIGLFTVVAMGQEIYEIVLTTRVHLKDLLLMFIYVEVLAMVGVYSASKRIPIKLPLYIAITALARLLILQGKDQGPTDILIEGTTILVIAIACFVLGSRPAGEAPARNQDDDI